MKIEKFEDLICWQKAKAIILTVYSLFGQIKDYGFRDQIQRASVSVMNNIAEGFERQSDNEFKRFLYIAKGSCSEVRSMCYLAKELGYIDEDNFNKLHFDATEICKIISGLIKTL